MFEILTYRLTEKSDAVGDTPLPPLDPFSQAAPPLCVRGSLTGWHAGWGGARVCPQILQLHSNYRALDENGDSKLNLEVRPSSGGFRPMSNLRSFFMTALIKKYPKSFLCVCYC